MAHSPDAAAGLANGSFPGLFGDPEFRRTAREFAAALRAGPVGAPRAVYLPAMMR